MGGSERPAAGPNRRPVLRAGDEPAADPASGRLTCLIETPRHSRCKFKYDEQNGLLRLHKLLPLGASFPYDFGFIPSTNAEDGDPLDVLVLGAEPLFPGCLVPIRLIGVLEAEQTDSDGKTVRNDRLIAVIETELNPAEFESLDQLGPQRLTEIEHFFVSYNEMEGRGRFRPLGRQGPEAARTLLERHSASKAENSPQAEPTENDSPHDGAPRKSKGTPPESSAPSPNDVPKSFSIQPGESFRKGMGRILSRQTKKVLEDLHGGDRHRQDKIHAIRKRFKRIRAALKLIRSELGSSAYRRENTVFRDAGRILNESRNAKVIRDALEKLQEEFADRIPRELSADVQRFLTTRQGELEQQTLADGISWDQLCGAVEEAGERFADYRFSRQGTKTLRKSLLQSLRSSRKTFLAAAENPEVALLHEWRKQTKTLFYQLQVIGRVAPAHDLLKSLDRLGEVLGDDHDLALLKADVQQCVERGLRPPAAPLLALVDGKRHELQEAAFAIGNAVFREEYGANLKHIRDWTRPGRRRKKAAAP